MDELARLQSRVLPLHRFDHHGGQFRPTFANDRERFIATVFEHQHVLDRTGENSGRSCNRAQALGSTHDHFVEDAVVAVGEDHDGVATGHRAGNAHRTHHGFRAGIAERDARHAGHLADQVGHFRSQRMLRSDLHATIELLLQRAHDVIGLVAEKIRAKTIEQVDVLVAVDVAQIRALAALDNNGVDQFLPQRIEAGHHARIGHPFAMRLAERLGTRSAVVVVDDEAINPLALCRRRGRMTIRTDPR